MHDRLEYVSRTSEARGVAQQRLCALAGLSAGWLSGALTRAKKDDGYKPDHKILAKLAAAAGVSLAWLEDGEGTPEAGIAAPRLPARVVPDATKPAEIALVEAFRRHPARYSAEDFLAALRVVGSDTEAKLPDDRERAVVAMGRVLGAVARLRRDGDAVTFEALAMTLAADDASNTEARRSSRPSASTLRRRRCSPPGVAPRPSRVLPKRMVGSEKRYRSIDTTATSVA